MGKGRLLVKALNRLIITSIISFLVFKWIEIFGLGCVNVLRFTLNLMAEKSFTLIIVQILFVIMAYAYISFAFNDQLLQLASGYGINLMERILNMLFYAICSFFSIFYWLWKKCNGIFDVKRLFIYACWKYS